MEDDMEKKEATIEETPVVEEDTTSDIDTDKKVDEENIKTFTQDELNEIVKSRVASTKRGDEKKYSKLVNALKTGMGIETDNINDITNKVLDFYKEQGVSFKDEPKLSEEDENILANAEAQKIIDLGYDAINSELEAVDGNSLSGRDKKVYEALANKKKEFERNKELEKIGVTKDEYSSKDFKDFASKFNSNTPYTEIYDIYEKTHKKKEPSPIGSMKSSAKDDEIKEYYSPEDFDKLTPEQLDNEKIWARVMESKKKWIS